MRRSSLDHSSEQKPRVSGGPATDKLDPGDRPDKTGSDVQETGMRSGRRIEGAEPEARDSDLDADRDSAGTAERAATVPETGNVPRDKTPEGTFATSGEIGDTGGATAQPARNEPGARDGNRRMTRGNRLRRGLRSRRKTYRQR